MQVEGGSKEVKAHYKWIEFQLKVHSQDANVAWLAVSLHHPPFDSAEEKNYLLPLLRKYNVDIIFTGHQHWMEYASMNSTYEIRFPHSKRGSLLED
mmetsp:Transcript_4297/g.5214  ORF Transcript_4297/g.5214 Transcript_4297/m.5214 type:complete len:96 (+) Transcript_4297:99-386(+)